MTPDNILLLSSSAVRALLPMAECIAVVEHAFRLHGEGKTLAPEVLRLHVCNGGFHVKAGVLSLSRNYFAAKVNANFPENPARCALPTIQGIIVLCDADNGMPLAILDSRDITALRTAAATAVAAKYLARPDARIVAVCGCGTQGRIQLAAMAQLFSLDEVFAYDKDAQQSSAYARQLSAELNIPVKATHDLPGCLRRCDICITCTTSTVPFVDEGHVQPGVFVAAVGADNPQKHEIHPAVMARSKIVCDIVEQCATMGDLHHALKAGVVKTEDVHAELGEIVAGRRPGRESTEEAIVFDSTGMALQDVAAAALVYEKAIREHAGTSLHLAG